MLEENRKHPRFETSIPIRFNLNPDYHHVPRIRKLGVGGSVRNISLQGLGIIARMDLLDLCQIFSEAMEEDSPFELELFLSDPKRGRELIKGAVRWHRLSESEGNTWQFQAGLYLKDAEGQATARGIIRSLPSMSSA
jgi:hypothetical protein